MAVMDVDMYPSRRCARQSVTADRAKLGCHCRRHLRGGKFHLDCGRLIPISSSILYLFPPEVIPAAVATWSSDGSYSCACPRHPTTTTRGARTARPVSHHRIGANSKRSREAPLLTSLTLHLQTSAVITSKLHQHLEGECIFSGHLEVETCRQQTNAYSNRQQHNNKGLYSR